MLSSLVLVFNSPKTFQFCVQKKMDKSLLFMIKLLSYSKDPDMVGLDQGSEKYFLEQKWLATILKIYEYKNSTNSAIVLNEHVIIVLWQ